MKYSTVKIEHSIEGKFNWTISFCDMPYDRKNQDTKPCPIGFYHYKRKQGPQKAFEELRSCMIKSHEKEIERLIKSRDSLVMLQLQKVKK